MSLPGCSIQNPLHGLSRKSLYERVDTFATEANFDIDRDLFYKAAVLAQKPANFEEQRELTEGDRLVLRTERDRESVSTCAS